MSSPPLLEVENLSVAFRGTDNVVEQVSFTIEPGEMLALVGESGSGKSVTALSILQLHSREQVRYPSGSIRLRGEEMMRTTDKQLRDIRGDTVSMIFQEPMTALNPLHSIGKQISEVIRLHRPMPKEEIRARVLELLDEVGLSSLKDRLRTYPHLLSGGERQRVMIAMAIANRPALLIADEPTTALDVSLQLQVMDLIGDLRKKHKLAVLLITHDLTQVRRYAKRVAIMQKGRIVEHGDTAEIFANPKHPYTQHLLASEPSGDAVPVDKEARQVMAAEQLKVWFPAKQTFFGTPTAWKKAVDGVSISLKQGETLGIVGESGSGKTTLGLALLRLIKSSGRIVFQTTQIDTLKTRQLRTMRQQMQFVFQDPYASLNPRMTIGDIVGEGLTVHHPELNRPARMARVEKVLEEVGLEPAMRQRYPHEFSGGQRQRINIARALILQPELIVFDEPTSALDLTLQAQIIALLRELQSKYGMAYLFISHDLRVIRAISHRIIVMKDGVIVEQGATQELFAKPENAYTKMLMNAAFSFGG